MIPLYPPHVGAHPKAQGVWYHSGRGSTRGHSGAGIGTPITLIKAGGHSVWSQSRDHSRESGRGGDKAEGQQAVPSKELGLSG